MLEINTPRELYSGVFHVFTYGYETPETLKLAFLV